MLCIHCGGAFHYSCVDPANSYDFSTIDTNNWTCPTCTAKKPKAIKDDNTPIRWGASQASANSTVTQRHKKKKTLSEPSSKVQTSDTELEMEQMRSKLEEALLETVQNRPRLPPQGPKQAESGSCWSCCEGSEPNAGDLFGSQSGPLRDGLNYFWRRTGSLAYYMRFPRLDALPAKVALSQHG
ncbi:unnamed protein product [Parnassius apollo]|uniref:(apollo) hypothetical protein n=1 Tax=Parnassius apollo TaxID=110799 RepID=A0A8S3W2Y5_PARAO|nr:unnamed protein product [Parnassius apollo]